MTLAIDDIQKTVRAHLAAEIECEAILGGSRVACVMPLQYPSGDSITAWVEQPGSTCRVSDYGESFIDMAGRSKRDMTAVRNLAVDLGARWGVEVKAGALVVLSKPDDLGSAVWRVAMVAHRVALVVQRFGPARGPHERAHGAFVREVTADLRARSVRLETGVRLSGKSGYRHKTTIFVPSVEAVVEPVDASGHHSQITSVYAKFGDLAQANGYRVLSLVDDRYGKLDDGLRGMLTQVSEVVAWTRRGEWVERLT